MALTSLGTGGRHVAVTAAETLRSHVAAAVATKSKIVTLCGAAKYPSTVTVRAYNGSSSSNPLKSSIRSSRTILSVSTTRTRTQPPHHHLPIVHHQQHQRRNMSSATELIESAKRAAAFKAVEEHLDPSFRYIGIGSGSTIKYVVDAIASMPRDVTSKMQFVPTGLQSKGLIRNAGLTVLAVDDIVLDFPEGSVPSQQYIDVCFDGADEVDPDLNLIKGGGACHYQEKLVALFAKKFICVCDYRKKVPQLLTNWPGVPIEVQPLATESVRRQLLALGSVKPIVRSGLPGKAGEIVTDNGNNVIDAPFPPLLLASQSGSADPSKGLWTVDALNARIKAINGVLAVGIFAGMTGPQALAQNQGGEKPIKVYFGNADGSIETMG